ncbi:MAG: serine/threonine-protein kinase [Pirellulaceae bacterium]
MNSSSDRNLLIALLALQSNFISQDQLLAAFRVWGKQKQQSIGDILCAQHALDQETHDLLLALAAKHIELHNHQPDLSLAAISSVGDELTEALKQIEDSDLSQSLTLVHPAQAKTVAESKFHSKVNDPGIGSQSSRFSIVRPHARGGLGEVFVAFDHELNRQVALKEIQGRHAFDEASRQRFMLEAEITGGLEHPGIVPVYGLGTYADGRPFYAMRFIKGNSLAEAGEQFHAEHPSPSLGDYRSSDFRKLLRRFVDVCFSIEYAHSRGVLHRDLKPGNIMLGKYGETLVVDWGLAKTNAGSNRSAGSLDEETLRPSSGSDSTQTRMGQAVGTPAYMSPEAAAGQLEKLGPAADIYCLGATLYFLIAGKAPFHRQGVDSLESVKKGQFPPPRQVNRLIPKSLEAICLHAMQRNPDRRYASAKALAEDVELWLADEPISVYNDPVSVRLGRFVRRNRAAVTSAGIFGMLLLAAAIIFATIVSQKNRQLADAIETSENNFAQAEQQRRLAEVNSETARGITMDVVEIAERQLSSFSGQEGFREQMMDRAYSLLTGMRAQEPEATDLAWELAKVSRLSGNVKLKLRKMDDARSRLEQSIELQQALNRSDLASKDYLSSTLRDLASYGKVVGDLQLATESFESASTLLDELLQLAPADKDLKRTLGSIELERIGLHLELLDNQAALVSAERCEAIYLEMAELPSVRDLDYVVALLATGRRGQALSLLGRNDEARQAYESGISRGREWIERSAMIDVRYALARLLLYFAADLSEAEQVAEDALPIIDEAIERFTILAETRGGVTYKYYHACALRTKAVIEQAASRLEDAEVNIDLSIQSLEAIIADAPKANYLSVLAECHALKSKLYSAKGDGASAKEFLANAIEQQERCLELGPNSLLERKTLAEYRKQLESL